MATDRRSLTGTRILVVEDHAPSAKLLVALLESDGAEVQVVRTAELGLVSLRSFAPEVVIVDLVLPKMSGMLFVQQLKADPATSHIVAIAVSVINSREVEGLARESGCAAYVPKPIDVETFAATIARHLKGQS